MEINILCQICIQFAKKDIFVRKIRKTVKEVHIKYTDFCTELNLNYIEQLNYFRILFDKKANTLQWTIAYSYCTNGSEPK